MPESLKKKKKKENKDFSIIEKQGCKG